MDKPVDISLYKRLQNLISIRNSTKSSQTLSFLELLQDQTMKSRLNHIKTNPHPQN